MPHSAQGFRRYCVLGYAYRYGAEMLSESKPFFDHLQSPEIHYSGQRSPSLDSVWDRLKQVT